MRKVINLMTPTLSNFIEQNKEKIYELARKNTKLNMNNQPTISKDDSWFYEDGWDELYSKLKGICTNAPILRTKDNMIELDKDNEQHIEWYEED